MIAVQPRLLDTPMAGVFPVDKDYANRLLTEWGHRLGPIDRPFGQLAYALELQGEPVAVAVSASTVGDRASGYRDWPKKEQPVSWLRGEIVECARLCAAPEHRWATRAMLRLWREVCAPRWPYWPCAAYVSYSVNRWHDGALYRFDGWRLVNDDCGFVSGSNYGRTADQYAASGKKSLWVWEPTLDLASVAHPGKSTTQGHLLAASSAVSASVGAARPLPGAEASW